MEWSRNFTGNASGTGDLSRAGTRSQRAAAARTHASRGGQCGSLELHVTVLLTGMPLGGGAQPQPPPQEVVSVERALFVPRHGSQEGNEIHTKPPTNMHTSSRKRREKKERGDPPRPCGPGPFSCRSCTLARATAAECVCVTEELPPAVGY